jgi:hypothetical protein
MEPPHKSDGSDESGARAPDSGPPEAVAPIDAGGVTEIEHYELDDVPLFHLPMAGATILTIAFRVGRADEPVIRGGMTHLAEHLVMTSVSDSLDHSNGTTEPYRVTFTLRGSPRDASRFLREVCSAIERPRFLRMHEEATVLRTEASSRQGPMGISLRLAWSRTGYQGIGTAGLSELFLGRLDEEELRSWIGENFVAGNAAIWIAGDLPDDLEVSLAPGPRRPMPEPRWIAGLETPTITLDEIPGVGVSFLVGRDAATSTAFRTLDRHLRRALRVDRGLGYEVGSDNIAVGPDQALVSVWSTCLPKATGEVERILLETIDDIAARGPTDDELAEMYERMARDMQDPMSIPARLESRLRDELFGASPVAMADRLDEQYRLQSDEVASAFRRARESMILVVPPSGNLPQRPFKLYPGPTRGSMGVGRTFGLASTKRQAPWAKAPTPTLTVAESGIAVDDIRGRRLVGIRWQDCVAVGWERDFRSVVGRDGWILRIFAGEWRDGRAAISLIDRLAPRDLLTPLVG